MTKFKRVLDKILFYGDPHGNFTPLIDAAKQKRPRAVFILGDFGLNKPLEQELAPLLDITPDIYWIPGNHDNDSEDQYDFCFNSALGENNIHARIVEIDGLRIAGLGGIFKGKIWFPKNRWEMPVIESRQELLEKTKENGKWRDGCPLKYRATIFPEDVSALMGKKCDILVTHEAATAVSSHGFFMINEVAKLLGASVAVHGHLHRSYSKRLNNGVLSVGCDRAQVCWGSEINAFLDKNRSTGKEKPMELIL